MYTQGLSAVLSSQWADLCAPGGVLEGREKVGVILCGGSVDLGAFGL